MKYTLSRLLIVCILAVSCDSESITNSFISANPPTAKISILNQEELEDNSVGDEITLEILLELEDMVPIKNIQFSIGFDGENFSPSNLVYGTSIVNSNSYQFEDHSNFFSLSGEPYTDSDGDGEWDSGPAEDFMDNNENGEWDQGEEYIDINGNSSYDGAAESFDDEDGDGEYDYAEVSPQGSIIVEENSFEGNLGVPSPEINGNKSGNGDICILYLSGIYTESLITLDIIGASEYNLSNESYIEVSPHWDSWDITSTIEVGSQYNPILTLVETDNSEGIITIEFNIEDSPQLADFSSVIIYDTEVLNVVEYEFLNFFNANYYNSYQNNIQDGKISISSIHSIMSEPLTDINSDPISQGSGGILRLQFFIADTSIVSTTLNILKDDTAAKGYSSSDSLVYDYNILFWDVQENITIDF